MSNIALSFLTMQRYDIFLNYNNFMVFFIFRLQKIPENAFSKYIFKILKRF